MGWYFSLLHQEEISHGAEPWPATLTGKDRRRFACKDRSSAGNMKTLETTSFKNIPVV